jgi:hypothetical protein
VFSFRFLWGGGGIWGCQEFPHHALLGQYSDDEKVVLMSPEVELEWVKIRTHMQLFRYKTQIILLLFSE